MRGVSTAGFVAIAVTTFLAALTLYPTIAEAATRKVCIDERGNPYPYDQKCEVVGTLTWNASEKTKEVRGTTLTAPTAAKRAASPAPAPKVDPKACPDGFSTHLVIGDSFNDLNFLNTANCNPAPAKGAQFSWARDGVAQNTQWSAKGAVAQKLIWLLSPDGPGPYVNLLAIAPVVTFQRVINSNAKVGATQNVDTLSYGLSSEALVAGLRDFMDKPWQVYLRARANVNSNFEGETKSWSTTFEFEPLSDAYLIGSNITIPGFGYVFYYPFGRVQYFRSVNNSTDPIFNLGREVLRAGPGISFSLIPQPEGEFDPKKPRPAPQWILTSTYTWYRDLFHPQDFLHWTTSFTYNVTDNIGVSLGYERGKIDSNGKDIDLATVSLTVKN
jgi:hypothetical protein